MKNKDTAYLLEKYYEGLTTVEEEKWLFDKLLNEEPTLNTAQLYFFNQEKTRAISNNFTKKFEERLRLNKFAKPFWLKFAAVLVAIIGIMLLLQPFKSNDSSTNGLIVSKSNPLDSAILLEDGSSIWLNKNSELKHPLTFSKDKREVYLSGEGYFEITTDLTRPFIVHTSNTKTEVLGTSFLIRGYSNANKTDIAVVSGKVSFSSIMDELQEKVFLLQGEKAQFDKSNNTISKFNVFNNNLLAWKTKKLKFDNTPMKEVIATLNTFYDDQVVIVENSRILNCSLTATFDNKPLEKILPVIAFSIACRYKKTDNGYLITGNGCEKHQ